MEVKQKVFKSQTKELDEKGRVLIAVNAFNNEDSDGDISKPGSFKKTLKENFDRIRWFLNHNSSILLGVPIKGYEEGSYLIMEAQFNLEKEIARDTYEDYKLYKEHGRSLEHSVGLQAIKYDVNDETYVRTVHEWKLWEFSTLTHWGSNEDTPLLNIKDKQKDIIEQMGNNPRYSDKRKQQIEQTQKALFIKPSTMTLKEEAAMNDFVSEFLTSNIFDNLKI